MPTPSKNLDVLTKGILKTGHDIQNTSVKCFSICKPLHMFYFVLSRVILLTKSTVNIHKYINTTMIIDMYTAPKQILDVILLPITIIYRK